MSAKVKVRAIEATFRVVTPLFSAGADPKVAEVRVPSLKGVLRFWWRALAWSEFGGDLGKIQEAEGELFGHAGEGARRSRVVMALEEVQPGRACQPDTILRESSGRLVGHGVRYLGYGLTGRGFRDECPEFKLHLRCRDVDDVAFGPLVRALQMLGTVGGLGARSRRGFGSLMLTSLMVDGVSGRAPGTLGELGQELRRLTGERLRGGLPSYTAFSTGARHVLVLGAAGETDPLVLLDRVGREMVRYRSFGKDARILGGEEQAERNFVDDHDLVREALDRGRDAHPRRVAFGLPHNYFFSGIGKPVNVGPAGGRDRRASPLFIHVHMVGPRPAAVLTFLPATFLPGRNPAVQVGRRATPLAPVERLYQPIHAFLDRMMGAGRKEHFGEALEVRHDAR